MRVEIRGLPRHAVHDVQLGMSHSQRLICLTGATGYIGGRLLRLLEDRGQAIRCLARRPERLRDRVAETTETVAADVLDRSSLISGLAGVDTAYYLVHSLESKGHFEQDDRAGAWKFIDALKLHSNVANLGDVRSLVVHPASTTHSQSDAEGLRRAGISQATIRLSVGIENVDDIIEDLEQALKG